MDEGQRELATNRLLEIIRGKGGGKGSAPEEPTPPPSPSPAVPASSPTAARGSSFIHQIAKQTPPPTAPSVTPEVPLPPKRQGMGLLEKVLAKPVEAPVKQAAPAAEKEEAIVPPITAPVPPAQPAAPMQVISGKTEAAPKEVPAEKPTKSSVAVTKAIPVEASESLAKKLLGGLKKLSAKKDGVKEDKAPAPKPEPLKAKAKPVKATGKRLFAVDIGASGVKVVELVRSGKGLAIVRLESRSIPPAMRKNPATLPVLQAKLLREMLPADKTRDAEVHLSIPDKLAQTRTVSVPGGAAAELINAIKFQIKKDLPFPIDACEIVYRGFDPKISGKQDLEILAADRKGIEGSVAIAGEVDILPTLVTSIPAASRYLIKDFTGIAAGAGAVVMVDIGASKTSITIIENDKLVFQRTLVTGGDDFTTALTGVALGPNGEELTDIQAEKFKIEVGLPTERDPVYMRAGMPMRPFAERIATEINRSLDFYRRERSAGEIKKIILCGGGALLKRLPEFLAENIGVEIILGTPAMRLNLVQGGGEALETAATELGPLFLPGIAVALADSKDFNMLPQQVKSALKLRAARGIIAPAALGVIVVLILLYTMALKSRGSVEDEFNRVGAKLKDLDLWRSKSQAAEVQFAELGAQFADRKADFDSIKIGEPEIPVYLKALSNLVPENIYLEKLGTRYVPEVDEATSSASEVGGNVKTVDMNSILTAFTKNFGDPLAVQEAATQPKVKRPVFGRVLEINGSIYPQGTMTDVRLVDFVFSLENSGYFRDVAVDSMGTLSSGKVRFRIFCGI